MAYDDLGADSSPRNDNIVAFPILRPGVPTFDPENPCHVRLWNSTWEMVKYQIERLREADQPHVDIISKAAVKTAYLVVMPTSWKEVLSLVEEVQQAWDDLDLEDEAESARIGDMHARAMIALTQFPAPDAAALEFKIRALHDADRIQCNVEIRNCLIADIVRIGSSQSSVDTILTRV